MLNRINHLSLFVNNIDEALDFYANKLGFVIKDDIDFNGTRWVTIHLPFQPDLEVALILADTPERSMLVGKQAADIPLWAIDTSNCQQTYGELKEKGVTFIEIPTQQPWGIQALCKDLYGNILCLVQNI